MRSYAAFVLHRGVPIARVELGPVKPIDEAARAWHEAIAEQLSETEPAEKRGRLVWQPLAKVFPDSVRTVYICPDPPLATIPWAALPTGRRDHVVLEDYAVALVPHGQFLLRQLAEEPMNTEVSEQLLLVGDVSYDNRPSTSAVDDPLLLAQRGKRDAAVGDQQLEWPYLPGSKREMLLCHPQSCPLQ